MKEVLQFIRESKEELRKVTWPNRDEVTSFTIVVVVTVVFISIFLWLIDTGLMALIKVVLR
ncbi:MAG TPA: preprotein translocase subunit SecE [Spirochaetota bacterium]|nr:preprotein translocase subunit SecE [Spirochaetota bacterium]HPI90263.1 preprotein translocase subunit SecE [Spirochaetota bacterium]HPR46496.1 preprotein translocase subunit SecE [Spirochaetota bacterium]